MHKTRARFSLIMVLLICSSFAIVFFAGCSKSAGPLNSADVMFVNGCFSAGSVSVKANSISVSGATAIPFLANSGYTYVTAGSGINLTFFQDNTGTPLGNRAENMAAAAHYTAFAGGVAGNAGYLFTADDLSPPAPGNAKVRFVNLSPDNINETGVANDTIVTQGITENTASSFYQVAKGIYFISAFDPDNKNTSIKGDTVSLAGGKIYTVLLTGSATGTLNNALILSVINNN